MARVATSVIQISRRRARRTSAAVRSLREAIIEVVSPRDCGIVSLLRQITIDRIHANALTGWTRNASIGTNWVALESFPVRDSVATAIAAHSHSSLYSRNLAKHRLDLRRELREIAVHSSLRQRFALVEMRKARPPTEKATFFRHRRQVRAFRVEHMRATATLHHLLGIARFPTRRALQRIGVKHLHSWFLRSSAATVLMSSSRNSTLRVAVAVVAVAAVAVGGGDGNWRCRCVCSAAAVAARRRRHRGRTAADTRQTVLPDASANGHSVLDIPRSLWLFKLPHLTSPHLTSPHLVVWRPDVPCASTASARKRHASKSFNTSRRINETQRVGRQTEPEYCRYLGTPDRLLECFELVVVFGSKSARADVERAGERARKGRRAAHLRCNYAR